MADIAINDGLHAHAADNVTQIIPLTVDEAINRHTSELAVLPPWYDVACEMESFSLSSNIVSGTSTALTMEELEASATAGARIAAETEDFTCAATASSENLADVECSFKEFTCESVAGARASSETERFTVSGTATGENKASGVCYVSNFQVDAELIGQNLIGVAATLEYTVGAGEISSVRLVDAASQAEYFKVDGTMLVGNILSAELELQRFTSGNTGYPTPDIAVAATLEYLITRCTLLAPSTFPDLLENERY